MPGRRPSLMLDPPCVLGSASPEKHSEWYIILPVVTSKLWAPFALRMDVVTDMVTGSWLVCAVICCFREKSVSGLLEGSHLILRPSRETMSSPLYIGFLHSRHVQLRGRLRATSMSSV